MLGIGWRIGPEGLLDGTRGDTAESLAQQEGCSPK